MITMRKNKLQILLISFTFMSTSLIYSTEPTSECANQFNDNKLAADEHHLQQTLNCLPGPGSVLSMLDPLDSSEVINDWFDCIREVDNGYYEVLDILASDMYDCIEDGGPDYN